VATAFVAFVKYLIVRAALKDTEPKDRPRILGTLATMFRAEWRLGPVRRERLNLVEDPPNGERRVGGSDEIAPTDST
jgi:hypothetical protein